MTKPKDNKTEADAALDEDVRVTQEALKKIRSKPKPSSAAQQRMAKEAADAEEAKNEFWRSLVKNGGLSVNNIAKNSNKR